MSVHNANAFGARLAALRLLRHRYCPRCAALRMRVCVCGLGIRIWHDYPAFLISPSQPELVASARRARKIKKRNTLKKSQGATV